MKHIISPSEVDFWLDTNKYSNFIDQTSDKLVFNIDLVRLASIRTAISNFVRILTRKNIPVYFNDCNMNANCDGKMITISAKINTKQDFDCVVGQSLHEAAHTLKTNFDIIKIAWSNIPHKIFKLSDSKNIRRATIERFIFDIFNVVEDRFIDNYVFNEAPGYRGYYVSLYERFWNSPKVDEYLLSDYFRVPSLKSYLYRIANFTNQNTDLNALPNLYAVAQEINISNIDRLKHTKDRIKTAFKIVEIVLESIEKEIEDEKSSGGGNNEQSKLANPNDYFDFGDSVDVSKKIINEISDIFNGKNENSTKLDESDDIVNKISTSSIPKEILTEIDNIMECQHYFLSGNLPKEDVTENQKVLLDLIEKHGIVLVQIDCTIPGHASTFKINCIVVQKMTKDLILCGRDVFPLSDIMKIGDRVPEPSLDTLTAVKSGILLGTKLGRKLQIRSELNPINTIRKKCGKINKRQLHEAAYDADDLFYNINIQPYGNVNLHITVDASGSMAGSKWLQTITAVVAICKAASMIDNIHVTVSFRTTQTSGNIELPYVILAYDSKVDKFSKVKNLFPFLSPNGCTPEGLAFSAIMTLFEKISPDENERYFVNLSDGEPYYILNSPDNKININYINDVGTSHTRCQVNKIKQLGIEILSYFITDNYSDIIKSSVGDKSLVENFRKMYGKNAKFISVNEINGLAKTLNDLFLNKKCS